MKILFEKESFLEKLNLASHFTSTKLGSLPALQGVFLKGEKDSLHIYSSNLNSFFHSKLPIKNTEGVKAIIEPKKIIEFVSLLPPGKIEAEIGEKKITFSSGKTKGAFPFINAEDFPLPPKLETKGQKLEAEFFLKNLPLILFATSADEARPALTGVNILTNGELTLVATDGFRLSLVKEKKAGEIPSVIIPGDFLRELLSLLKEEKKVEFKYSPTDKIIEFDISDTNLFTRTIEGDFPPFERVIPTEKKTVIIVDKEEFVRNIKLISIFARDYSHVTILDTQKGGIRLRPKMEGGEENSAFQEADVEGESQTIAFNYRFLLDFFNNTGGKKIIIEILRSDAPVVFKTENEKNFIHIIMPVRIQE